MEADVGDDPAGVGAVEGDGRTGDPLQVVGGRRELGQAQPPQPALVGDEGGQVGAAAGTRGREVTGGQGLQSGQVEGHEAVAHAPTVGPSSGGVVWQGPGMSRRHRVTDIAAQAGLSRATVDRVLHGRPGVRPETVTQVERAVEELDRQRAQVELSGRALILDLVMQAPARFAVASQRALEAELRSLRPAVVRVRSHLSEESDPAALRPRSTTYGDVGRTASSSRRPTTRRWPQRSTGWSGAGVPVVTFVTDVSASRRIGVRRGRQPRGRARRRRTS